MASGSIYLIAPSGAFKKAENKLIGMSKGKITQALTKYGEQGVSALKTATPVETSATAAGWYFKVQQLGKLWQLGWYNSNSTDAGIPVAILIQYGHGTGTGGYVAGEDFINPAIKPIFDKIRAEIRREVTK